MLFVTFQLASGLVNTFAHLRERLFMGLYNLKKEIWVVDFNQV